MFLNRAETANHHTKTLTCTTIDFAMRLVLYDTNVRWPVGLFAWPDIAHVHVLDNVANIWVQEPKNMESQKKSEQTTQWVFHDSLETWKNTNRCTSSDS